LSDPFKDIVGIDRVVHEPARLALLLALDLCASADFKYLQARTGLSDSNLSVHLTKLESAGLVTIEKIRRGPRTIVRISKDGKAPMRAYRVRRTVLRDQDVAEAERITQILKSEGWTHANHSQLSAGTQPRAESS